MHRYFVVVAPLLAAQTAVLRAQAENPLSREVRNAYVTTRNNILLSAEKMPEEWYSFRPAPRVRTFGQILGHLAEEQYFFCNAVTGGTKAVDVEKTKTSKADLIAALRQAFADCDMAYDGLTDAVALQQVARGKDQQRSKLSILWGNTIHNESHYGNLVTYMRIKGLVPPSTEGN
jgi:uncharacterized damage-inducible protein DinB